MYNCSFIDFDHIYNYKKGDYILSYIIENNIDIIFITNYYNYSIYIDIDNEYDNVFYSDIEDNYNMYKGKIYNNKCNLIIVNKKFGEFKKMKNKKIFNNLSIKPLILFNSIYNLTLICIDNSKNNTSHNINLVNFIYNINNYTILGGSFNHKIKFFNACLTQKINNNEYYYGILLKNLCYKNMEYINTELFNNFLVNCKCICIEDYNTNIIKRYFNKFTNLFK